LLSFNKIIFLKSRMYLIHREVFMKKNVCGMDQKIRIGLGIIILSLSIAGPRSAWGLLGLIPLLTGLIGYCPAYKMIGRKDCDQSDKDS
jgi:hypothetical protein